MCVGETLEEREREQTLRVLDRQLKVGLDGLSAENVAALAVAYEPVWAIGTGRNATSAQAQEAHANIRGRLREWFGTESADACRILYGGSVKPANTKELVSQADVDGALVGGASLDPKAFAEIVAASRPGRI
jgi:triosephosphate isomerase